MLVIISLLIGFFISFILSLLMTSITLAFGDMAMMIHSIYIAIALIISSTILIIGIIIKHFPNKQD